MKEARYTIVPVDETNVAAAGAVHAASWQDAHRSFCTPEFVAVHGSKAQTAYLKEELAAGTQIFMLIDDAPAGVVSVHGDLIENLYILPEKQRRGYGAALLRFAERQCAHTPELWILENNRVAHDMYVHRGYQLTGKRNQLAETVFEIEMKKQA